MFKTKRDFYLTLFKEGLTNECREYLSSLHHQELVELIVELDYRLWRSCQEITGFSGDNDKWKYQSHWKCIGDILQDNIPSETEEGGY